VADDLFFGPCILTCSISIIGIELQTFRRGRQRYVKKETRNIVNSTHLISKVVLLKSGPSAGSIAVIAEIIDHNRVNVVSPLLNFSLRGIHNLLLGNN
jgi:hypothetical protein